MDYRETPLEPPQTLAGSSSSNRVYVLRVHPRLEPTAPLIGIVLVERSESFEKIDDDVISAKIVFRYEQIWPPVFGQRKTGSFQGWFRRGQISVTDGAVELGLDALKGNRLGTYFFSQVVSWAKKWPGSPVAPLKVTAAYGAEEENLSRRNSLYENAALSMVYSDEAHTNGRSENCTAESLTIRNTWQQNIKVISLAEAVGVAHTQLEYLRDRFDGLKQSFDHRSSEIDQARRSPFAWAVLQAASRFSPHWMLLMGLFIGFSVAWSLLTE